MILIRRCRRLFKTRITCIIAQNRTFGHVQLCLPHLCNSCVTSICRTKLHTHSFKSVQTSNYSNVARGSRINSKEQFLRTNINNRHVNIITIESIIKDIENDVCSMSESLSLKLLSCCGSALYNKPSKVRQELANRVWDLSRKRNCDLTIDHYHALLQTYIDNDCRIDPTEFLKSMTIKPEYDTYCLLLQVLPSTDDTTPELLIADVDKADEKIYNALVYAYAMKGNTEKAKDIVRLMKEQNIEPSFVTEMHLMLAFARNNDMEALKESLFIYKPSTPHVMKVIKFLSLSGNGVRIPEVLSYLQPLTEEDHSVISVIVQLVHEGRFLDAYKLVAHIPLSDEAQCLKEAFALCLLKEMIEVNCDKETVLKVISDLEQGVSNIWESAAVLTLTETNETLAFAIFSEMTAKGVSISCDCFWPFFLKKTECAQEGYIYSIIREMVALNVELDSTTFTDYIFPHIDTSDPIRTIKKMLANGMSSDCVIEPFIKFLLYSGRLKAGLTVCSYFKIRVDCQDMLNVLLLNFRRSKDIDSCIDFLFKACYNGNGFAGIFLKRLLDYAQDDMKPVTKFMLAMKQHKAVISYAEARVIRNKIARSSVNEEEHISKLISRLTATSDSNHSSKSFIHPEHMNLQQLYSHLKELKEKGMNTRGVLRRIFMALFRSNNMHRINEIVQEMNSNHFKWTPAMKSCLFQYYVTNKMTDEASSVLHEIQCQFEDFQIDNFKITRYATLLIEHDEMDKALDVVRNTKVNQKTNAQIAIHELLSLLITKDVSNYTESMIKLLIEHGYCKDHTYALRYLILLQILRGNIESAARVFRTCVEEYNKTPAKQQLLTEIVRSFPNKSSRKLQQDVYGLIARVHGKDQADVNLAIAFCLCDQMENLQNLFERSSISQAILLKQLEYLKDDDVITFTLRLLENIKHTKGLDLKFICDFTLTIYDKQNDYKHALELQEKMEEKGIEVSEDFKRTLAKLVI